MTHPLIQQIVADLNVRIEEVNAVIAGERLADDGTRLRIMRALGTNGRGVYLLAVWKGDPIPNALRNTPNYDYFGQTLEALNLALDKHGYTSRLLVSSSELVNYDYFEEIITRYDNVGIFNVASNFAGDLKRACDAHRRPVLYLDFPADEDPTDEYILNVYSQSAIEDVIAQLYALGHRRIAFVCGPLNKVSSVERFEGYKGGLMKVGLDYDAALVEDGNWQHESGVKAAQKLLVLEPRPTAIIAANDRMAFGVMEAVENHGLKIPDDISVVGYDDIAASQMATPPLTSVRTPMSEMGAKAGEYMVALLEGARPEPRLVCFPLEIVVRESIGPAPSQKPR